MNAYVEKLHRIASGPERTIIGLMSGTSMDGLDIALCRFRGSGTGTEAEILEFTTIPFEEHVKDEVRKVFARREIDFQHLTLLNAWIGDMHGRLVLQALDSWGVSPDSVDAVASHGQTVFHAPKILHGLPDFGNATLQIGDGDHIAVRTGIITLSDFRQKHIAAGGEGAPLAVYGDFLLFSHPDRPRILLNIGGIANFTYLPGGKVAEGVFVTDTGPGNTLLDAATRSFFPPKSFDEDGKLAASGRIWPELLNALKENSFFGKPAPKTTGPELFNLEYLRQAQERSASLGASPEDILATLTRFSAETIAESIRRDAPLWEMADFYLSGGGAHNPVLVGHLSELLPGRAMAPFDRLGFSGDAKEALLFAVLANETLAGGQVRFQGIPSVCMGKISFPG
ncbi:MAG: anhydro-N-acetylmuramic acid kinase [Haliscomenobacter sp.]|nr:anhydro-N-acetylmuramic acid kinase [Haliscomenobacter sp.]